MEWVTPLGIPIIQPYHRDSKVMVGAAPPPPPPPRVPVRAGLLTLPTPLLQISGGIQSLTFSHSGDTSQ